MLEWGAYFLASCLEGIKHLGAGDRKASLLMEWHAKESRKDNVKEDALSSTALKTMVAYSLQ